MLLGPRPRLCRPQGIGAGRRHPLPRRSGQCFLWQDNAITGLDGDRGQCGQGGPQCEGSGPFGGPVAGEGSSVSAPRPPDDQALRWLTTQTGSECVREARTVMETCTGHERESCGDPEDNKGVWRGHACVRVCARARPSYSDAGQEEQGPRRRGVGGRPCGSCGGLGETLGFPSPTPSGGRGSQDPLRTQRAVSWSARSPGRGPRPPAPPTGTNDGGCESGEKGLRTKTGHRGICPGAAVARRTLLMGLQGSDSGSWALSGTFCPTSRQHSCRQPPSVLPVPDHPCHAPSQLTTPRPPVTVGSTRLSPTPHRSLNTSHPTAEP